MQTIYGKCNSSMCECCLAPALMMLAGFKECKQPGIFLTASRNQCVSLTANTCCFRLYNLIQERNRDGSIRYVHLPMLSKEQEAQRLAARGFLPPPQDDFADLCNLPVLNEDSILNNLRTRFHKKKIYTYAGSILIAINPFKFLPIYNPKYVKMYENHQLGKLEPHIFAIADVAYYAMLRKKVNQCIVISGESGSGKTQSTNFLIHCLTALSQKGYASGVERTILGAGPVLEVR